MRQRDPEAVPVQCSSRDPDADKEKDSCLNEEVAAQKEEIEVSSSLT